MSFDEYFMRKVYLAASKSKDPRTKIGAVLIRDKNSIIDGYNGFPRRVHDYPERYQDREVKYDFIVHAEANTVLTAARLGIRTEGSILYTQGVPCSECIKALIQGGIVEIVVHKQWPNLLYSTKWVESFKKTEIMMNEAGINLRWFDGVLGVTGQLDGKLINV